MISIALEATYIVITLVSTERLVDFCQNCGKNSRSCSGHLLFWKTPHCFDEGLGGGVFFCGGKIDEGYRAFGWMYAGGLS